MIIWYLLAALGTHRLWNYEDVFKDVRESLRTNILLKPIWCEACNAFWIMVLWTTLYLLQQPLFDAMAYTLAGYLPLRASIWVYHFSDRLLGGGSCAPSAASPAARPSVAFTPPMARPQAVEVLLAKQKEYQAFTERVVILTFLAGFDACYSIGSVICDQARMLALDPKRRVEIWVMQTCDQSGVPSGLRDAPNVRIRAVVPAVPFIPGEADPKAVKIVKEALLRELIPLGSAVVIAHDILFQDQVTVLAAAVHAIAGVPGFRWYHVTHSGPSPRPTGLTPEKGSYYVRTLPKGHKLLCVSSAQREGFATHYATDVANIRPVPNARDPRGCWNLPPRVNLLVTTARLLDADVVQVLPLSSTRLEAKGVDMVLRLLGSMRRQGADVRLILVNAHANADKEKEALKSLYPLAQTYGMLDSDLWVTSLLFPETEAQGLPQHETQELLRLANVFIYPSVTEACSLVTMEAALAGNMLVLNADVPSMKDIAPLGSTIYYPWNQQTANVKNGSLSMEKFDEIIFKQAEEILVNLQRERGLSNKMAIRRAHSYETVGAKLLEAIRD